MLREGQSSQATAKEIEQLLSNIERELKPWAKSGITLEMVERVYCFSTWTASLRLQVSFRLCHSLVTSMKAMLHLIPERAIGKGRGSALAERRNPGFPPGVSSVGQFICQDQFGVLGA